MYLNNGFKDINEIDTKDGFHLVLAEYKI
jgi:hypothetical protein